MTQWPYIVASSAFIMAPLPAQSAKATKATISPRACGAFVALSSAPIFGPHRPKTRFPCEVRQFSAPPLGIGERRRFADCLTRAAALDLEKGFQMEDSG
ncbi:hypothetical protein [Sphingopyxis sp.]|uniref:hypothetical protein n=1 Tax=Sphingopyxis sp. TaxID=1908224 RepID=UPI002B498B31|nr:hypothetical protein [Sphingopyxis sp.]HJS12983.1 hypothetical protein [Sphingopyxis sp.]